MSELFMFIGAILGFVGLSSGIMEFILLIQNNWENWETCLIITLVFGVVGAICMCIGGVIEHRNNNKRRKK